MIARLAVLLVVALPLAGCISRPTTGAWPSSPPSFVIILADDLGWADVGYHGSDIGTPNIDRLAATGVRLEQHYVFPVCSPTRAALLTGRGPSRFDILSPIGGTSGQHLPPATPTLPGALREAGYATHLSGKWHLGLRPELGPRKYGFETSYGYLHGQVDPYTHRYKFGDRTWHRDDEFIDEEGHATDLITADAVRFIETRDERPFLLWVAYSVPHFPLAEPEEWMAKHPGIEDRWRRLFAASVAHMDDGIGAIVAALDRSGLRETTLVVFISDNGGQQRWSAPDDQYEGRFEPHLTLGNNRPLRGWKGDLHEGGIRVPALANWPGTLPEGGGVSSPTSVLDWMPTLCALAGVHAPASDLEGEDIRPLLAGAPAEHPRRLYWKTNRLAAIRDGDWKLIAGRDGGVELFDLSVDPYEARDLAGEHPDRVERLAALLDGEQRRDPRPEP